jgi:hypothetical protein
LNHFNLLFLQQLVLSYLFIEPFQSLVPPTISIIISFYYELLAVYRCKAYL